LRYPLQSFARNSNGAVKCLTQLLNRTTRKRSIEAKFERGAGSFRGRAVPCAIPTEISSMAVSSAEFMNFSMRSKNLRRNEIEIEFNLHSDSLRRAFWIKRGGTISTVAWT